MRTRATRSSSILAGTEIAVWLGNAATTVTPRAFALFILSTRPSTTTRP